MSIRRFLKEVGISNHQEIEVAIRKALDEGKITDGQRLKATMTLEIPELGLKHQVDGQIDTGGD